VAAFKKKKPFLWPYGPHLTHWQASAELAVSQALRQFTVTKRNGSATKKSKKEKKLHEDAEAAAARRSGWWISGTSGPGKVSAHQQHPLSKAQIQAVLVQNFSHFKVGDDDVDVENKLWATPIAHGGGMLDEEDAVSALLLLARWVNVVEMDVDQEWTQSAWL